jgi:1-acyl-sn-glycerol-3-phosphate acyltransferase
MLCEWGRVRGEHPPPILAREPQGSRAFVFSRDHFQRAGPNGSPEPCAFALARRADFLWDLSLTGSGGSGTQKTRPMMKDFAAWIIRIVCGVRLIPAGALPPSPAIYFANHSSHLDFVTIWAALPAAVRRRVRPVAGRDYWEKTALRKRIAADFFHAVLIERQRVTVACSPLEPMVAALDQGAPLIVFPEGTRSRDGAVQEFKSGLYHLAKARPEIPLVPVYLQNLSRILPKGDFLPVPILGSLTVGEPVRLGPGETKADFLGRARSAVDQLSL